MKYIKAVLIIMFVLVLSSCSSASQASLEIPQLIKPIEIKYDTTKPHIGDITSSLRLEGYVMPFKTQELSFSADNSKLKDIYVTLGQQVTQGELIAETDTTDTNKAIAQKQEYIEKINKSNAYTNNQKKLTLQKLSLELEDLNKQLNIYSTLQDNFSTVAIEEVRNDIKLKTIEIEQAKLDSTQALEAQQLELSLQQQTLDKLKNNLLDNKLYAACSGVVVFIDKIQAGDRVTPYKTVVQIADNSQLVVGYLGDQRFPSSIIDIELNIAGKTYSGIPIEEEKASLVVADKTVTAEPKKIQIVNANNDIKAGQYAAIEIVYRKKKDLILIPYNCLIISDNGNYVYVSEDGKKVRKPVKVGVSNQTEVEIVEGLTLDDTIYINSVAEEYRTGTVADVKKGDLLSYSFLQGTTMPSKSVKLHFDYDDARFTKLYVSKGRQIKASEGIAEVELESKATDIKTDTISLEALKNELKDNDLLKQNEIKQSENELNILLRNYERDKAIASYAQRDLDKQLLNIELKKISIAILKNNYEGYLFDKGYAISQSEKNLDDLKIDLSKTAIAAPFDGVITEITSLKPMQLIDKDDVVAVIATNHNPLIQLTNINAADISYGMKVDITIGKQKYTGRIISCPGILASGSPLINSAVVEIYDSNDKNINVNGATADVKILKKEVKDVVIVDKDAVKQYNGRQYVYILEDGMKKQRYIVTGSTDGTYFEVLEGLSVGQKVIVD